MLSTLSPALPKAPDRGAPATLRKQLPTIFVLTIPVWSGLLYHFGLYRSARTEPWWSEPLRVVKVSIIGFLVLGALIFGLKLRHGVFREVREPSPEEDVPGCFRPARAERGHQRSH